MAQVTFDILARDRASKTFSSVGKSADGLGSRLGKFSAVAGTALAGATVAAAGLGAAAGMMGLKTASALEQAQISFETLLGSGEEAKDFLEDLKKFAAKTPFELPGLVSASRQLLGVGHAAEDVLPTLEAWGDTAGALGLNQEQFERAMLAVTQSMSKGKVQAEELMQITEAGIPIYKLLSKALDKPIPVLQKMMEKGELLAKDVFPALEEQMKKDYGGAMAKQAETLQGQWSTLMDTLNLGLADAIKPMIPWLKEHMPGAIKTLGDTLKTVGDIGKGIADRIGPPLQTAKGLWDGFVNGLMGGTAGGAGKFKDATDAGAVLRDVFYDLKGAFTTARDGITDFWAVAGPPLGKLADELKVNLGPGLREVSDSLNEDLAPAFANFTEALGIHVATITEETNPKLVGSFRHSFTEISDLMSATSGVMNGAALAMEGDWDSLWKHMTSTSDKRTYEIFSSLVSRLGAIPGQTSLIGNRIGQSIVGWSRDIQPAMDRVKARIILYFADSITWLQDAGRNIGAGLVIGIQSKFAEVQEAGRNLAAKAAIAVNKALKIKSPSRVMIEVGKFVGSGLVMGMNKAKPAVEKAAEIMVSRITHATERLKAAKAARDEFASSVASTMMGFGSITSTDDSEAAKSPVAQMRDRLKQMKEFAYRMQRLKALGLNSRTFRELIEAGPEAGGALAEQLVRGGKKAVKEVNGINWQMGKVSGQLGKSAAGKLYGAGVQVAQGLLNGLKSQRWGLIKLMSRIAKDLVATLKKSLKIHSPSRVTEGLGKYVGQGFAQGIAGTQGLVDSAITGLSGTTIAGAVPQGSLMTSAAPARPAAPQTVRVVVDVRGGDDEMKRLIRKWIRTDNLLQGARA